MSDLSDLLGSLFGSESGSGQSNGLDGVLDLLGGLMQSDTAEKKEPPQKKAKDSFDFEQLFQVIAALQTDDKNIRLLRALEPHLTPERAARTEDVIKIMRMASLLPLLHFSGDAKQADTNTEEDSHGSLE